MSLFGRQAFWRTAGARRLAGGVAALWTSFLVSTALLPCCDVLALAAARDAAVVEGGEHAGCHDADPHPPARTGCTSFTALTFAGSEAKPVIPTVAGGLDFPVVATISHPVPPYDRPVLVDFHPPPPPAGFHRRALRRLL